jgi:UrcA family protein
MKIPTNAQSAALPSMIATALLATTCLASAGTAQALELEQPLTKKVAYGDLNLDSEQGAKALYARLRFAAKEVCTPLRASSWPVAWFGRHASTTPWRRRWGKSTDPWSRQCTIAVSIAPAQVE